MVLADPDDGEGVLLEFGAGVSLLESLVEVGFAVLAEDELGWAKSCTGEVTLDRTRSRTCMTPLLVRKSDRMMFAVMPFSVTVYDWSVEFCVNV